MISGRDDADLLVRLRRKDPESVGVLYDRYGKAAYDLALRVLGNNDAAESVVAEAALKCWNKVAAFRETRGSALGAWFLVTAYLEALEHRGRSGSKSLERGAIFQDWAKSMDFDRVQEAYLGLRKLDLDERQILDLAFFEGLSPAELGGRLGRTRAEIDKLIQSTLGKLAMLELE